METYFGQEDLRSIAHGAILDMLSYNVSKKEAYKYLTNQIDIIKGSYELQCCIYDLDPILYIRECDKVLKECRV